MSNYRYEALYGYVINKGSKIVTIEKHQNAFSRYLSLHIKCPLYALLCTRKYARGITLQMPVYTWYSLYVKNSLKAQNRSPVVEGGGQNDPS